MTLKTLLPTISILAILVSTFFSKEYSEIITGVIIFLVIINAINFMFKTDKLEQKLKLSQEGRDRDIKHYEELLNQGDKVILNLQDIYRSTQLEILSRRIQVQELKIKVNKLISVIKKSRTLTSAKWHEQYWKEHQSLLVEETFSPKTIETTDKKSE